MRVGHPSRAGGASATAWRRPPATALPSCVFQARRPPAASGAAAVHQRGPAAAAVAAPPLSSAAAASRLQRARCLIVTAAAGSSSSSSSRARRMAGSKYEYTRRFEADDSLLQQCWIVIRVDGKGFTKFSEAHGFAKPNDKRALDLMDEAAKCVMREYPEARLAYGESDEYSFVLHKDTQLYGRRASKLVSTFVSCFTGNYVRHWPAFLQGQELLTCPVFDGRAVAYPNLAVLRDYLCWRQADTHVNNQYNTCFWALVKAGQTPAEAQDTLKGTDAAFKNELLFSRFGINYAQLPEQFRRGSLVVREGVATVVKTREDGTPVTRTKPQERVLHCDIIGQQFWDERGHAMLAPL